MATIVVLVEGGRPGVTLDPSAMAALAELGVTSLTLVRDGEAVGVIVEGWAFDAESFAAAVGALGADRIGTRVLFPVSQTAVSASSTLAAAARYGGGTT
jgi:hypothetical protein